MKLKRVFSILLAALMCISVMTGCLSGGDEGTDGDIVLRFWNIWGGGDANHEAVRKVINDFNASHPGVRVVVEYFENEAYKTMIRTAVAGDEVADVFSTWGAGFSRPFYEAGKLLNLDEYLNDGTLDKLYGGALNYFIYDDSVYGLTIGRNVSGFFVNTKVFEDAGAEIPATWEELVEASEKILASGKIPIMTSSRERWVIGMLFEGMVTKAVGASKVNATINKEADGGYSDPLFLEAINRLGELIDNGFINSDRAALTRDEALASFINGDAGLYYMGSWECSALEDDSSLIKGNVDWIPFPTIPGGKGAPTDFNGGAIDGLVVSANTAHPEAAAAFVKYFTENLSREGDYMPVWNTVEIDMAIRPAVFARIIEATENATDYVIWWDTFLDGDDVTIYQDALDRFVNGTITAEQFHEELKKIHP
ncbi:MAG: extracellular solute-binding protein [Defluviitaleaceae bacterium]|nr:extracellular solute-binding protein [Defluviitaleaceae bacterium]MCL2836244.1 extracellular solute-binding protein [Defluviitaleaceae bacterium]